jgi:hypothetical protein
MAHEQDLKILASPLNKIGSLFVNKPNQLVPFKAGTVKSAINSSAKTPPIDLSTSGGALNLGGIGVLVSLPGTIESAIGHLVTFNIPGLVGDLESLAGDVFNIVVYQASVVLSFLAVFENTGRSPDVAKSVEQGYEDYFFGSKGYMTVDGSTIAPPSLTPQSTAAPTVSDLRTYFSLRTGEQYTRDLVRVTVEASGDKLFNLKVRYAALIRSGNQQAKQWFEGYAALAESTVTSAVEEALLGVATFSTNALFAAAVGSFAGTAARKATQNAFLQEIGIPIGTLPP